MTSSAILVFSDGSFSVNNDESLQLGYMLLIADGNNAGNIIAFSSTNSRRVGRSVLGAEPFGMEDAFDATIVIQHDLINI